MVCGILCLDKGVNCIILFSSATNTTRVPNQTTLYHLSTLQFPRGLRSNVTLQAVNDVGASKHSNPEKYNIPSGKSSNDIA